MQNILVTGGAGFIGSHTVDLLLERGYRVRVLDLLQQRVHPHGWPAYLAPAAEKMRGDVRLKQDWERALDGIDGVIHLAAYQDYMPDFGTFLHTNTVSVGLLFETIVERGLPVQKVVLASSQAVYGEGKYVCAEHGTTYPEQRLAERLAQGEWEISCPQCGQTMVPQPLTEDTVRPHTAYGISKYSSELASFSLGRKYGVPTVNLRYSIVQGPRNSFYNAYSGICRIFTLRLLHGHPPVCYEDGQQLRDYVYVGDVARANLLALEDPRAAYQALNVAGMRGTTVLEYARLVARVTGVGVEPVLGGDYRFGDTRHTVSSWRALGALGWAPTTSLEAVIEEYVDWVKQQPDLADYYVSVEASMRAANVLRTAAAP